MMRWINTSQMGLAERGKLDPVIGRDEEVQRVMQVLQNGKNNPVLIGEPGVGKQLSGRHRATHRHRRCAGGTPRQKVGASTSGP